METLKSQQLLLQHVRQLSADVAEFKPEGIASLAENLANWITAQIVGAAKSATSEIENGCPDLKSLSAYPAKSDLIRLNPT